MNAYNRLKLFFAKALVNGIPTDTKRAPFDNGGVNNEVTMSVLKGVVTWSGQNAQAFVNQGYSSNDIVYSIINMITGKAKIAPWGAFKVKDQAKYKLYQAKMATLGSLLEDKSKPTAFKEALREAMELKAESLVPYDSDPKLNELMKYPNENDTWSDIIEALGGFKLITGNAYLWGPRIMAGKNAEKPLWLMPLPSQWMSIIANLEATYASVKGYRLYMGAGIGQPIDKEEILHIKNFNPQWNASGQQLYGMSPLQAADRRVTRINESLTASVANLQNGGPAVALYVDDQRMEGDNAVAQAVALKQKLVEYSGAKNKNRIATSGYKLGKVDIGLSNVDLDIIAGEKHDLRFLCNVYNIPSTLMNDPEAKNENNQIAAEKALTVRAALPILCSIRDRLNYKFTADWGFPGIVTDFDLSVYPELQEDKMTQATFLDIAYVTLKARYEAMGIEIPEGITEEMLNTIYYKGQPLSEPGMNDPLLDPYAEPKK